MYIIVFSLLIFSNASVVRKSETKVDEQGRRYHYSEKYEEEFIYENDKCFEDESDAQLEVQHGMLILYLEFQYDEDVEGFGDSKDVYADKEEVKENVDGFGDGEEVYQEKELSNSKITGFGKGVNIYKEEETKKSVVGFGEGEEVYEKEKEPSNLRGFGIGEAVYTNDENEKETVQEQGFGEPLGTIDDYENAQSNLISLNKRRLNN